MTEFDDEVRDTFRNVFYQGANFILAHNDVGVNYTLASNVEACVRQALVMRALHLEMKAYEEIAMNQALAGMMKDAAS